MRNRTLPIALAAALHLAAAPLASQGPGDDGYEVWLSAREGVSRIAIALPVPESGDELGAAARALAEIARNDLYVSGTFDVVDPALYALVEADARRDADRRVAAKRWMGIGARYLVESKLRRTVDGVSLEAYLVELQEGDQVLGRRYSGEESQLRDMAHALADDLLAYWTGHRGLFTSRIAYAARRGGGQEIFVSDYDGGRERQVTRSGALSLSPAPSPGGEWIAFSSLLTGDWDLYLAEVASGEIRPLMAGKGSQISPSWCPLDGSDRLAFSSSHEGSPDLYTILASGEGMARLTFHDGIDVSPSWSPGCREIAFISDRTGIAQLHVIGVDGANLRRLTRGRQPVAAPAWSPDGSAIAFMRRTKQGWKVCVLDLARNEELCLAGEGSSDSPTWSPDGRFLAFVSGGSGDSALFVARADGTAPPRRVQLRGTPKTPEWIR